MNGQHNKKEGILFRHLHRRFVFGPESDQISSPMI